MSDPESHEPELQLRTMQTVFNFNNQVVLVLWEDEVVE